MTDYKRLGKPAYTVKLMLPELKRTFLKYKKRCGNLIGNYFKLNRLHVGLKYLGYENKFTDRYMLKFVPELKIMAKKYLPLKLTIKGLGAFWSSPKWPQKQPVIFLRVIPNKKLNAFHKEIRACVRNKVDIFLLAEGRNYTPHCTLGLGRPEKIKELRKLVVQSRKDKPITIVAKRFAMRLKGGKTKYILKI